MTTTLEILELLWNKLDSSPIKVDISGSVCKQRRDPGSDKEDIVINCLPAPNTQLQRVIANVNIHVPDVVVSENGMTDRQPNLIRLDQLATEAMGILEDTWISNMNYDVQQQGLYQDEDARSHYVNIRLEFFIENV